MIDVNSLKEFIEYICNFEQSGRRMSKDEYNNNLLSAQLDIINERYGNPKEYQVGMPLPRQVYEATQKLTDDLKNLKEKINISVDSEGKAILPGDYFHISAIRHKYIKNRDCGQSPLTKEVNVKILPESQIAARLSSSIKVPTKEYPIADFYGKHILCYPNVSLNGEDLKEIIFVYLRYPITPFWSSEIIPEGEVKNGITGDGLTETYDPTTSVQIELPFSMRNEIAAKILRYIGINLREPQLEQYALRKDTQGT